MDPNTDVFGVPLVKAMKLEEGRTLMPSQEIPTVLDLILCNLEFKGLEAEVFLKSNPDSPSVNKVRNTLSKGSLPSTLNGETDVLAGLLRRYLNELPEPLVPVNFYKNFMETLTSTKKFKNGKDKGGVKVVREIVEGREFSRVHYHALRRICALLKGVLTSWWSDDSESRQVVLRVAISILRPDNLSRESSPKELASICDAVTILISHSDTIFVVDQLSASDIAARRQSMIRRGERASRLQIDQDDLAASSGLESSRSKRSTMDFGASPRREEFELRAELRFFKDHSFHQIKALTDIVKLLHAEVVKLQEAQGITPMEFVIPSVLTTTTSAVPPPTFASSYRSPSGSTSNSIIQANPAQPTTIAEDCSVEEDIPTESDGDAELLSSVKSLEEAVTGSPATSKTPLDKKKSEKELSKEVEETKSEKDTKEKKAKSKK